MLSLQKDPGFNPQHRMELEFAMPAVGQNKNIFKCFLKNNEICITWEEKQIKINYSYTSL